MAASSKNHEIIMHCSPCPATQFKVSWQLCTAKLSNKSCLLRTVAPCAICATYTSFAQFLPLCAARNVYDIADSDANVDAAACRIRFPVEFLFAGYAEAKRPFQYRKSVSFPVRLPFISCVFCVVLFCALFTTTNIAFCFALPFATRKPARLERPRLCAAGPA